MAPKPFLTSETPNDFKNNRNAICCFENIIFRNLKLSETELLKFVEKAGPGNPGDPSS